MKVKVKVIIDWLGTISKESIVTEILGEESVRSFTPEEVSSESRLEAGGIIRHCVTLVGYTRPEEPQA